MHDASQVTDLALALAHLATVKEAIFVAGGALPALLQEALPVLKWQGDVARHKSGGRQLGEAGAGRQSAVAYCAIVAIARCAELSAELAAAEARASAAEALLSEARADAEGSRARIGAWAAAAAAAS